MNHKQLIDALFNTSTGASKASIDRTLHDLSAVIVRELQTNGSFTLNGIGTLAVVDSAAREGRNPLTGEKLHIPAKKRVKLKACKALKSAVA